MIGNVVPGSVTDQEWYADDDVTLLVGIEPDYSTTDADDVEKESQVKLLKEISQHLEKSMGDNIDEATMDLIEKINETLRSLT